MYATATTAVPAFNVPNSTLEERLCIAADDIGKAEFPDGLTGKDLSEAIGEISDTDFDRMAALYKAGDREAFANLMFSKIEGYWEGWINNRAAEAVGLK